MPSRRLLLPGAAFVAALVLAAVAFASSGDDPVTVDTDEVATAEEAESSSRDDGDAPSPERMAPLRVEQPGMTVGDPDAPLVMVAFESFGCLWCGHFHRSTMPVVLDEYVDAGLLRIESRMFPYEERALPGARIGAAAGRQDRYWALAEHLYPFIAGAGAPPVGRELDDDELSAYRERQTEEALLARVEQVADDIDLDWERFLADYESDEVADSVEADQALAYQLGFTGTPAFVVNGVPSGGYSSPEQFRALLDGVLAASEG